MEDNAKKVDPSAYIAERTKDFTGREWVFDTFDRWLGDPGAPRFLVMTGEPGSGKTAIAAKLTQIRQLDASHFCIARRGDTIDPLRFTRSLSHQLARIDRFALGILEEQSIQVDVRINVLENYGQIVGMHIENLSIDAPSATIAFNRAVLDPLNHLYADGFRRQLVILVDALDEAAQQRGPESIVDLLANTRGLPRQVRFVLTSRPDSPALRHLEHPQTPDELLDVGQDKSLRDVRQYVRRQLEGSELSDALQARLAEQGMQRKTFIDDVTAASQGSFLYLVWLLPSIADGSQRFDELDLLPKGLDDIYRQFLRTREVGRRIDRWRTWYRPLLGVLAVAEDALSAEQLAQFTGLSPQEVDDALQDVKQFLDPSLARRGQHQLYHQSVADFLDDRDKAQEFWIDLSACHRRIVQHYRPGKTSWARVDWRSWDAYGLRNLVTHLVAVEQADQLDGISKLLTRKYLDYSKGRLGTELPFLNDVNLAFRNANPKEIVGLSRQILYRLPANSYRAMSILKTLVEQTRNEERLQETLEAAQDRAGGTVAKAILLLALEEPQDLLEQLRLLQQQAPDSDLPVIYLAYGLSGDPGAQDALLHAFAALDKRATREKDNRLYAEHHTRGWYAAEGLRELGPDRCTDETVKALVTMLQAETRNRMWAIYIVSRWGERGVARLGDDGQAFRSAVREGLGQRRSEWLSARASDAVALLPDQFPRDEAIRLLCDVLGLAPGQREVAAEEVGKRMYAKKRAAVALSKIAARDEALLEALRDHRKQVGRLTVDEKDRAHRRGLEEGLERAIRDIARRGPVTGSDEQPGSGSGGRNARESA